MYRNRETGVVGRSQGEHQKLGERLQGKVLLRGHYCQSRSHRMVQAVT